MNKNSLIIICISLIFFGCDYYKIKRADKYARSGYFKIAIKEYEKVLTGTNDKNKRSELLLKIGIICFKQKQYEKAEKTIFESIKSSDNIEGGVLALGRLYLVRGDLKKLVDFYEDIRKKYKFLYSNPVFLLYLGKAYLDLNLFSQAEKVLKIIIEGAYSNEYKSNGYHYLGLLNLKLGSHDVGVDQIKKAISLDPQNPSNYISLGIELAKSGEMDKARDVFLKSIKLKPDNSEAYFNLGHISHIKGNIDEALAHYNNSLKQGNDSLETHYRLAILYLDKDNFEFSRYHLNKIKNTDSGFANIDLQYGKIHFFENNLDLAIKSLKKGLILYPKDEENIYFLALVYGNAQQIEKSLEYLLRLEKLNSKYKNLYSKIADLYLILGKRGDALKFYMKELRRNSGAYDAYIGMAKLEASSKKPRIKNVEKFLKKALEAGFQDKKALLESPYLKKVIKNDRILSLLSELSDN